MGDFASATHWLGGGSGRNRGGDAPDTDRKAMERLQSRTRGADDGRSSGSDVEPESGPLSLYLRNRRRLRIDELPVSGGRLPRPPSGSPLDGSGRKT